jgi:hypothetical protein
LTTGGGVAIVIPSPEETEMVRMHRALLLALLSVCGCNVEEDPNSRDFGPQPWPGWCVRSTYSDGEYINHSIYTWENGLLVQTTSFVGEEQGSCSIYSYRDDDRLIEHAQDTSCDGFIDIVTSYEWGENGQLSSSIRKSYSVYTGEPYNCSGSIFTYGPNDELVRRDSGDCDPETEELTLTGNREYYYDDLLRLLRVVVNPHEDGGADEVRQLSYQQDTPLVVEMGIDRPVGGVVETLVHFFYDERGWKITAIVDEYPDTNTGGSDFFYDENDNLILAEDHDGLRWTEYTYDCWE